MIIKKLILHNFGVYASTNTFEFRGQKPIVLIGGMNGRGKTTFLEAVLLSLYGSKSFAYKESNYKTFGQYLKSFVNRLDGTLESYVELEFVMESDIYRVHREWSGAKQRISEIIKVYKDGEYNQFLTDNWMMFIENILPSGLSNFFFFDGEKIAKLAIEDTNMQMKESIKTLLGISLLELLKGDLGRIINRISKNQIASSETKEIQILREKKDRTIKVVELVDEEIEKLEKQKTEIQQQLEQKRQEYSSKGGDIVTQRQELFRKRSMIISRIEALREQLVSDAASELPFVLVKELLRNIRENAEIEQDQKVLEVAIKKMKALLSEYTKQNAEDQNAAYRFIHYIDDKMVPHTNITRYTLSDTSLFKLQVLLDEQLTKTKLEIFDRQKELAKLQAEVVQIDNYMSVDIDEKAIATIYRQIKELEQKLIEINVLLTQKADERRIRNGEMISAISVFNKSVELYLRRVELNDDSDRIIKYSHIALAILEEYIIRLQKNKIDTVADTMTVCYKKLANKKNMIERIEMEPNSLDLRYLNADGEEVNKTSLSAGEKQLMVISLLWALALCSKKKLPVIIDTPLSRLDSAHRESLIQIYFPYASEQTIILSTDSEIDHKYHKLMKNNIGDEFTLVYDDSTKSTTIRRGYFEEDE